MKFLVVDDHPVLREGLVALLGQTFALSTIILASTVEESFEALAAHADFDLIVLDLNMPSMGGMEAITEFGRRRADLPIIVLSSSEDARDVRRSIALGALGYVSKSANQQSLIAAIRLVLDGNVYVPPFLLDDPIKSTKLTGTPTLEIQRLTPRQLEILTLLSRGESNRAIAKTLDLAEKTVKVHITTIFKILNVVNRTQAAAVGREAGLI